MALIVKVSEKSKNLIEKSVIIGNQYKMEESVEDSEDIYVTKYQFDMFKKQSKQWLWIHKDECLVSIFFAIIICFLVSWTYGC